MKAKGWFKGEAVMENTAAPNDKVPRKRDYRFDNLRFLLMLLVIFGHTLELFEGNVTGVIYKVIYTFHMPAFMFLTGYFAKFRIKKLIFNFAVPYFVFQIIYILFDKFVLGNEETALQFIKPYWLLWYLMAGAFCFLLVPLFAKMGKTAAVICVAVLTACSLLAGFVPIGYGMSLSRFIVFLPFFASGFFARKFKVVEKFDAWKGKLLTAAVCIAGAALGFVYIFSFSVPEKLLYGSYSYSATDCTVFDRAAVLMTAFGLTVLFLLIIPNIKIPVITQMGMDTFVPYIFHGFAVKLAGKYHLLRFSEGINLILAIGASLLLYCLLSGTAQIIKKPKQAGEN